ncbi:MAG: DUF4286 family protein [Bacteroidota bacterium]
MILYNVTVKVDHHIHEDWLKWMKEVHIPDVLKTGLFSGHRFFRLLHEETDGTTYAIQYYCDSMQQFEQYQRKHAKALQADHMTRYKDHYVAFRTLMEAIE